MLKIYNTLSRKKEPFVPLSSPVTMYSCGPTVYSYAHIGNMRAYIFMDLVRRVLTYNGHKIKGMMNITDVGHLVSDADEGEDKLEKAGREAGLSPYEIAEKFTKVFFWDLKKLGISKPEIIEKATDHIDDMLEFVYGLLDKGFAYKTSDGIYFDISKFTSYGQLSGQRLEENIAGARVVVNDEKRHPADFALWKNAPKEHIMQWPSRFGMGFPGWHIECSALGRKYLGDTFDIHTGGVDHIPIHHENEIAQSQSLSGKKPVNYWMHGEFMQVNGGKMSKSLGNVYTLSQLEEMGYPAMSYRYFCLNTHYRKKLNFTFEAMDGAKIAYQRLLLMVVSHKNGEHKLSQEQISEYKEQFLQAINDDINIPLALGHLWSMLKNPASKDIYQLAIQFDKVFGLELDKAEEKQESTIKEGVPKEIEELLELRREARAVKNYAASDRFRAQINQLGYTVIDSASGQSVTKK